MTEYHAELSIMQYKGIFTTTTSMQATVRIRNPIWTKQTQIKKHTVHIAAFHNCQNKTKISSNNNGGLWITCIEPDFFL